VTLPEKIEEVLKLEAEANSKEWFSSAKGRYLAAVRKIVPDLIAAYTAALTALEASDSDRKKLKARIKELEAELAKAKTDR
jgi:uncharacterized protein (DUF2461 family)